MQNLVQVYYHTFTIFLFKKWGKDKHLLVMSKQYSVQYIFAIWIM
jgi:hypothetical protein